MDHVPEDCGRVAACLRFSGSSSRSRDLMPGDECRGAGRVGDGQHFKIAEDSAEGRNGSQPT